MTITNICECPAVEVLPAVVVVDWVTGTADVVEVVDEAADEAPLQLARVSTRIRTAKQSLNFLGI